MSDNESYSWPPVIPITENPEEILSRASHELKHPVMTIKGFADLILNEQFDTREAAERIFKAASQAEELLNAIFDYLRARRVSD
jgi:signal transduction histidine kinase